MRLAGLNIEGGIVRAAIINRLPGRSTLVGSRSYALDQSDHARRDKDFSSLLEHLRDKDNVRAVVVGISMTSFSHHMLTFPALKMADIAHALGFELEKHLPLPPDEYSYGFSVLSQAGSQESRVMVLAALRNRIRWIRRSVEDAGLVLVGIRCSALEALNDFLSSGLPSRDSILFYQGHDALTMFAIGRESIEDIKIVPDSDVPGCADIMAGFEQYDKGAFSTAESGEAEMGDIETRRLSYDIPEILAASAFKKRKVDMVFASSTGGRAVTLWQEHTPALLAIVCVLLVLLAAIVPYFKDRSALRRVNEELGQLKAQAESLSEVKKEISNMESRTEFLRRFSEEKGLRTRALGELSAILPDNAWLTSFSSDEEGKIVIRGYAMRASDIFRPLKASRIFKNAEFTSPVTISNNREKFTISMEMDK